MGKLWSGLRRWWQSVAESTQGTVKLVRRSALKPPFTHSFMMTETEEGLEILLGLMFGVLFAGTIAVRWGILLEFVAGVVTGGVLMAAWEQMMERRSQQRFVVAGNVAQVGLISRATAGYERVEWLNRLLKRAWPYVISATEVSRPIIRDCLEPLLEEYRLGTYQVIREQPDVQRVEKYIPVEEVITSLHVNAISLGTTPPRIEGLKVHEMEEGKIICKVRMEWHSDARITLGVGTATGIVPFNLENLKIVTTVRVILRIKEPPPFVDAIVATIPPQSKPIVDFTLSLVDSSTKVLPVVTKRLRRFVTNFIFDTFLWPHRLVLPIIPRSKGLDLKELYLRPHGQLSVAVIKGDNLVNMYPYVTMYCRPLFKLRTKSIENTNHPTWNEEFTLDVEDKETQKLTLQVMNENKGPDEHVSTVAYPLKDLALDQDVELQLDLKPRKKYDKDLDLALDQDVKLRLEVQPRKQYDDGVDGEIRKFGSLTVELRYHVYTDLEGEAAMRAKEELNKVLATPDEPGSYTTAMDIIHP